MSVAIVGIGCRFPGGVSDPEAFWRVLREGRTVVGEIPPDRMDAARLFAPKPAPGHITTRFGGFLEAIDGLDAGFFGISPHEAERMDPQQRLLLETAWEAIEDAGADAAALAGTRTGVYVGQWLSDFEARLLADPEGFDFYMTTGSGRYASSGRISYALGLRGPSLTLDTACSSSLAAVHLAAKAIRSGECELALAGGANVLLQPHVTIAYSQSGMMAPDGRCKFGDASGDGYVRSEGAALVLLKPLARALADGDRIYAVVRGSAVNNDGRSSGSMGTPSRAGQEELLRAAHRDAGVRGGDVGYVEAHGTGTRTGDPVELGALAAVLGEGRAAGARALVGSVKTNLGHTEGAAGVAGLVKAALALHRGVVPPSLHLSTPNPAVPWATAPLAIPTAEAPFPAGAGPRLAGVSAFGIAGTNAHVVLEEAPAAAAAQAAEGPARAVAVLPLSARSPAALRALAGRYADLLAAPRAPALGDVCFAAATRRTALEHRAVFVGAERGALVDALRRYAAGEAAATAEGAAPEAPRKVAFVAPGQGGQWAGMARELHAREPVFRDALERCDAAARAVAGWSILEQLEAAAGGRGEDIDVVQPVLVAVTIAYGALWRSLGVNPAGLVGHSMGEVAAAHLSGALSLEDAMRVVCRRSALLRRIAGRGAMALVELSWDDARAALRGREDRLAVAASNGPRSSVLSGDPAALDAVLAELEARGVFCRRVKVDVASHSPQVEPLTGELARDLAALAPADGAVPLHSTVLGRRAEGRDLGAAYWVRNLREPVRFREAVEALAREGVTAFVELGPHPVLVPSIEQTTRAAGLDAVAVSSGRREEPQLETLLAALGALWAAGTPVDWRAVLPAGAPVRLPLYPWQRERHWVDAAEPAARGRGPGRAARPDDEALGWLHRLRWEPSAPGARAAPAPARWFVLGPDLEAARALAARLGPAEAAPLDGLEARIADAARREGSCGIVLVAPAGEDAAYLPVRAAQAVARAGGAAALRLWFVTRGAQAAGPGPSRTSPWQAALWGAARVVGEEHPAHWGGLVDLDPAAGEDGAALLAAHLGALDGEDQVALRGGQRLALRLSRLDPGRAPEAPPLREDAAYLVTGGLGDIGLRVAGLLADRGARRLVLAGRTPLPPRAAWGAADLAAPAAARVAAVRALEARGVAVHVAALDVGDEAALRGFLAAWAAEGWPALRGVFHCAGAFENRLAASMDRAAFDAVVRSKLGGAVLLDALLPALDHLVLFSSTGGFLAQPGQANYAAANAGLDAVAADRRARGLPALSVAWGVWKGTGLVKNAAGEQNVAQMEAQGLRAFEPERGLALLGHLLGHAEPTVVVLPLDGAAYARARPGRPSPLLAELIGGGAAATSADALASADPAERRARIEAIVVAAAARVLKLPAARLDRRKTLGSMGLTSLLAMELRNRLEAELGRPLSATLAWNHPTVAAMVEHLAGDGPAQPPAAREPAAAPAPALGDVAALSDEEAARALRAGRRRGGA